MRTTCRSSGDGYLSRDRRDRRQKTEDRKRQEEGRKGGAGRAGKKDVPTSAAVTSGVLVTSGAGHDRYVPVTQMKFSRMYIDIN